MQPQVLDNNKCTLQKAQYLILQHPKALLVSGDAESIYSVPRLLSSFSHLTMD